MKSLKIAFLAFVAAAAIAAVPAANAQTLHFAASGSSAMFQQFGISVVNDIAEGSATCGGQPVGTNCSVHHFTIKGSCSDSTLAGTPCVGVNDTRNHAIPPETATFWAAWVCPLPADCNGSNATDVWYYNQVDSTVGVRTYLGSAQTVVAAGTKAGTDLPTNTLPAALLLHGDPTGACGGPTTCDAAMIPADVYAAINNSVLNTGMTDIRPEDALFATKRANSTSTLSPWTGLGYGGGPSTLVGASIASAFTATFATPVAFGLPGGTDPFTSAAIPSTIKVFAVGEEPIVFIVNRRNSSGLGSLNGGNPWYNNVVDNVASGPMAYSPSPIGQLFGGVTCSGSSPAIGNWNGTTFTAGLPPSAADFAVNPILREALSGTMNTVEFSSFRTFGGQLKNVGGSSVSNSNVSVTTSQESNLVAVAGNAPINPLGGPQSSNPPGTPCTTNGGSGLGKRYRAVGTGEMVGKSATACSSGFTGVGCVGDSIGYTFFSFANVSALSKSTNYGYLQLDGVDPIFASYTGSEPGQATSVEQGALPACIPANNGTPGGCEATDVWASGVSFPNLRNGTYRAWSLLRAMCDTASAHCTTSSDALGTEAIIVAAQKDIHNNNNHAVADFLPFSDDNSFGVAGGFGDAQYVRSHYAFNSAVGASSNTYPSTHITPSFSILPSGLNPDQANGAGGSPEAGGDAGGCIVAALPPSVMAITDFFGTNGSGGLWTKRKFDYTPLGSNALVGVCGPGGSPNMAGAPCTASFTAQCGDATGTLGVSCNPPPTGMSIAVTGFSGANQIINGTWQVTRIINDGQIKVRVVPNSAFPSARTTASAQGSANEAGRQFGTCLFLSFGYEPDPFRRIHSVVDFIQLLNSRYLEQGFSDMEKRFIRMQPFASSGKALLFSLLLVSLSAGSWGQSSQPGPSTPQPAPKSSQADTQAGRSKENSDATGQEADPAQGNSYTATSTDNKDGKPAGSELYEDWNTLKIPTNIQAADPTPPTVKEFPEFTRELVQVAWRPADIIDLYIVKPKGVKNPPVILYLYSFPSDEERFKNDDFAKLTSQYGFASVGWVSALTGSRFHDRPMKEWFVGDLQEALATSVHDVQLILNYLDKRGDLDMSRVGMFGDGSGASIAIMAASVDPRIKALQLFGTWGDWPDWIAKSKFIQLEDERAAYLKPEFLKKVENLDPVKYLPQLKNQGLKLEYLDTDSVTPLVARQRIEKAAPLDSVIIEYASPKEFMGVAGTHGEMFDWLKQQLVPDLAVKHQVGAQAPIQAVPAMPAAQP